MAKKRSATGPSSSSDPPRPPKRPRTGLGAAAQPQPAEDEFVSPQARAKWEKFSARNVNPGRTVDLDSLVGFPIADIYTHMGWRYFLQLKKDFYPHLIRLFFCNLTISADRETLVSRVKGVEIRLTIELLNTIFQSPQTGERVYFTNRWPFPTLPDYPEAQLFQNTYVGMHNTPAEIKATNLIPLARLANAIHLYNVVPRGGHFDALLPFHLFLCNAVVGRIDLNLGYILFNVMADATTGSGVLPFGMALTRVFEHFNVDLRNEIKGSKALPINGRSVKKMKLLDDQDEESSEESEGEGEGEEDPDVALYRRRTTVGDLNDFELRMNDRIRSYKGRTAQHVFTLFERNRDSFNELNAKVVKAQEELGGVRQEVAELKREVKVEIGELRQSLTDRFDEIIAFLRTLNPDN